MNNESLIEENSIENSLLEDSDIHVMQDLSFVLFGATGDLAQRKIFPALYNLFLEGKLPKKISIVGLGRSDWTNEIFQSNIEKSLRTHSRKAVKVPELQVFLAKFRYCVFDATNTDSYHTLDNLLKDRESELGIPGNRIFYLSVAPKLVDIIALGLHKNGVNQTKGWGRLIVEKPFGSDLKSAQLLNETLSKAFSEKDIYRIDHYLGKPIVQNIETLVFANPNLGPLLADHQISNVQITASETVGVENRADYYDQAGTIRDMVQNHLLQLVMMTALHLPEKTTSKEIRDKKIEIIKSLRRITKDDVQRDIVRGQYKAGEVLDTPVVAYNEEPGIGADSQNDTYFAARLYIDTPAWCGIPFYIRTGKRMDEKSTRIVFELTRNVIETDAHPSEEITPCLLILEIGPNEGVSLVVDLKKPSIERFDASCINFSTYFEDQSEAYELLIHDAMLGNATFFAPWKEVELSWEWTQPILDAFEENLLPLHPYAAGSKGPEAADQLLQSDQFNWW